MCHAEISAPKVFGPPLWPCPPMYQKHQQRISYIIGSQKRVGWFLFAMFLAGASASHTCAKKEGLLFP